MYTHCNQGGRAQGARLLVKTRCKCQRKGRPQKQAEAQAPFPRLICDHGTQVNTSPKLALNYVTASRLDG